MRKRSLKDKRIRRKATCKGSTMTKRKNETTKERLGWISRRDNKDKKKGKK